MIIKTKSRFLKEISKTAQKYEAKAYLVGGPLRDRLLRKRVLDLDIAIEGDIRKVAKALSKKFKAKLIFYKEFNTATLVAGKRRIDLAQTRRETYPKPASLPKVFPSDIDSDLKRRDFTINAMALDLAKGELIDPYKGYEDLKRGLIKILHPKSFTDDPTRIFRAFRFAKRLRFKIEKETEKGLRDAIRLIKRLSGERVLYELTLICKEKRRVEMLKALRDYEIYEFDIKGLNNLKKIADPHLSLLYLFALLENSINISRFPLKKEELRIVKEIRAFGRVRDLLKKANLPSEIYRFLCKFHNQTLKILEKIEKGEIGRKVSLYLKKYGRVKLSISGEDLKRLGLEPSPKYGRILKQVLYAKLDNKIISKRAELSYAKSLIKDSKKPQTCPPHKAFGRRGGFLIKEVI